ncbi:uncharacterized protein EV420DRAFT_1653431 [Desarmillaria tabescens]|uniref:Uncharacterized protein n=1 Tax=Armillaria tabescens TaxID=1929756 RepID=A0AA39MIN7_ARMTA|nr:uncharacterized protein EV420DRAFT_1653431 [Desarmillaria tabescens]KAK0435124.1 hypothetical protein EV420DRAFT_1653431 [Desarmillaria tabescens]
MLPPDLTPSKIRSNPAILLHNGAANTSLGPFDGKWGTVFDNIDCFIITPNAGMICMPPMGTNREVYMRANYRYGHDDPLQWPQAYVEQFPHLACIRRIEPDPSDIFHPLYRSLTNYDFVECDPSAIVEGVGCLCRPTFLKLQKACHIIIESMDTVKANESVIRSMRGHLSMIEHLLERLHALPTSFSHVCLTFAETQRVAQELRAFVEYMTVFKPLMDAPEHDAPSLPVDEDLMGTFCNDATVVQRFFKASIPVWRIILMKDLGGTRIDALFPFVTSPITEEPCRLRLPSMFVGSLRDPKKYLKIQEFVMHSLQWIDPFALASPIILSRNDIPLAKATLSSRFSPYNKKNTRPQPKRLLDPQHLLLPPLVEPWRLALLAVDADPVHCHSCARPALSNPSANPRENQYAFPQPDIIATLNTEEKVDSFLVSWLRLHTPLYTRLTETECVLPNLYHQEWHTVLALGFLHMASEPSGQTNKATKQCQEVSRMMDGYLDDFPLRADNDASTAFWKGKAYESLTDEERHEICWELTEVNFHCEFRALHCQATVNSGQITEVFELSQCFPYG